jgi:hypothetical protein
LQGASRGREPATAEILNVRSTLAEHRVDPAPPSVDPGSRLIGCERAAERVMVSVSSHLDPRCTYTGGFDLSTSGVVFDCLGIFDVGARPPSRSPT